MNNLMIFCQNCGAEVAHYESRTPGHWDDLWRCGECLTTYHTVYGDRMGGASDSTYVYPKQTFEDFKQMFLKDFAL